MNIIPKPCHHSSLHDIVNLLASEDLNPLAAGLLNGRLKQKSDRDGEKHIIQHLPFEILRHIFLLAVTLAYPPLSPSGPPPTERRRYRIAPTLDSEPISLTRVCSWWRAVALAVPELWTAVSGMPDWTQRTTPGVLRVWMHHMAVSTAPHRACPMDLHLAHRVPTPPDPHEAARLARILRLFWAHLAHVRALQLRLESGMLQEVRALLRAPASPPSMALEEVDLTFVLSAGSRVDEINRVIWWLGRLPNLRRLRWIYLPTGRSYQGVTIDKLPWSTLEEVLIRFPMTLETSVACISRCTAAKTISLEALAWVASSDDDLDDAGPSVDMSIFTLPALSSLTLFDTDATRLLINYLTLPALKYLNIRTMPSHRPRHAAIDLKSFLVRSQCQLEELILRQPNEWPPDWKEFYSLPGISRLRVLDLFYHDSWENMLAFLATGGHECLTQLGIPKVMVWNAKVSYQGIAWEDHVGWKDRFKKDEFVSAVYDCF